MVQIILSLLFVIATATIVPTLAHPPHPPHHEETDSDGSSFSRRFYGGDATVVAREFGVDLQQREPSWDAILHPHRTWKEHRRKKAITAAAKAQAEADIKQEHVEALSGRDYFSEALAARSFDDFDFGARDFEEEYY